MGKKMGRVMGEVKTLQGGWNHAGHPQNHYIISAGGWGTADSIPGLGRSTQPHLYVVPSDGARPRIKFSKRFQKKKSRCSSEGSGFP